MNIYIAGPISGDLEYKKKFDAVERGYAAASEIVHVLNPADLPEGMTQAEYMALCLPMLLLADLVVLLPGWKQSGGARIEQALAEYTGKQIYELSEQDLLDIMEEQTDVHLQKR